MITTGCEGCCFFKKDAKGAGCVLGQFCVTQDSEVYAPGYCRFCRSSKWAGKQKTKSLSLLYDKVLEERCLKFDMLVIFDEACNNFDDLVRTIDNDWYKKYVNDIMIVDVTGFGERENVALRYIKNHDKDANIIVDSSVEHESIQDRESTIRRMAMKLKSKFFLSIPAGKIISNIDILANQIKTLGTRYIHWNFRFNIANTTVLNSKLYHGLFITKAYKTLIKFPDDKQFTQRLREEEIETGILLSSCVENCRMIS